MKPNKRFYKLSDKKLRVLMFNKYDGKCAYCGCDLIKMHIDHIRPIDRHNMSEDDKTKLEISNLTPSCPSCNCSKSNFTLEIYRNIINKNHTFYFETL